MRLQDYRDLPAGEQYDKLVSIEMLEAVGHRYLEDWCRTVARALKPEGRLAVISFHSLEDRIVKRFMAAHAKAPPADRRLPQMDTFRPTRKLVGGAIKGDASEIKSNPRARSAVLRVAEKLGEAA